MALRLLLAYGPIVLFAVGIRLIAPYLDKRAARRSRGGAATG